MKVFTFKELAARCPRHEAHMLWDFERLYRRDKGKMQLQKKVMISLDEYWSGNYYNAVGKLGFIESFTGCINSGKSESLLIKCHEMLSNQVPFICVQPKGGSGVLRSSSGLLSMQAITVNSLSEIFDNYFNLSTLYEGSKAAIGISQQSQDRPPHAVVISDFHMFEIESLELIKKWKSLNVWFYVASLDKDALGRPLAFGSGQKGYEYLKSESDVNNPLYAECHICGKAAMFSQCHTDDTHKKVSYELADLLLSSDLYAPVCLKHFKNKA